MIPQYLSYNFALKLSPLQYSKPQEHNVLYYFVMYYTMFRLLHNSESFNYTITKPIIYLF